MAQESEALLPKNRSRRSFLGKLSLGLAALGGLAILFRGFTRLRPSKSSIAMSDFPGEDSIFHPRRDPRLEARERRNKGRL